jgi:FkbM family methyltransferase
LTFENFELHKLQLREWLMGRRFEGLARSLFNTYRRATGGKRFSAYGHQLSVDIGTNLPRSRRYPLPGAGARSELIAYADHVQLRSIYNHLDSVDGPNVIEVGAYTGAYACIVGALIQSRNGRLLAIEPDPQNCKLLRENVKLNRLEQVVTIEEAAVSDTEGTANLTVGGTQSTIGQTGHGAISVPMITLKTLIARHQIKKVDLLLIDVEGAELQVLRGFPWGTVSADYILCELHPYAWKQFGYEAASLDDFFKVHGFLPVDMFMTPWPKLPDAKVHIGPTLLVSVNTGTNPQ